jgi:ABC-type dipeptide/oligopeptide/nickel transport system ATPase component
MIAQALVKLRPSSSWEVIGDDVYENINWKDTVQSKPTKQEVEDKVAELIQARKDIQYQKDRRKEYPSIPDQLDTLYHSGLDAWKAQIKTVKDKYPKV